MNGIADTGFLVAFANRRDAFFPSAHSLAGNVHQPLLTCKAVLAEGSGSVCEVEDIRPKVTADYADDADKGSPAG